ncbi:hypothetical protein METH109765_09275 [Mesobacillus thioparans]
MENQELLIGEENKKVEEVTDIKTNMVTCHHALVHNPFVWENDEK